MISKLSKNELQLLVDIMHQCLTVTHEEDLLAVIDNTRNLLSFEAAALCSIKKSHSPNGFIHCINRGYDSEWNQLYRSNAYHRVDPVLRVGMQVSRPFTWLEARTSEPFIHEKIFHFLRRASDFGLKNGIAFFCQPPNSEHHSTLISLSIGKQAIPKYWALILELILPHLHEAFCRIQNNGKIGEVGSVLTYREVEILKWGKEGKSSWEIGSILGISERTVKFHFNNIFKKLDVVNRPQAVARAMTEGLI